MENKHTGSEIGVIGLSVMGSNLAMNIADHGHEVAVFNRSPEKTEELVTSYGKDNIKPHFELEKFVCSLETPRRVLLMVQSGDAVDQVIGQLEKYLEHGDIIIDGGNSFFKDTIRREQQLKEKGIAFVGMGVSGGEEGARRGPSIMPGGSNMAWIALESMLKEIAAKDFHGNPCVAHIGENGSGHYVKMVHNGIEYIDMQLIAEIYWIMKNGIGMGNSQIAEQFEKWNEGRLDSYLIEITAKVLKAKNANGTYVLDSILDSAGSKGTGKWTSEEILELGVPGFGMVSAVLARSASAHKKERIILANEFKNNKKDGCKLEISQLENALYVSKIFAYAQGYELLREASMKYDWKLDFKEISRIWEGGCIIRAEFLQQLETVFADNDKLASIMLAPALKKSIENGIEDLRLVAAYSVQNILPAPALMSGLLYFDLMTSELSSANLIQAQRDFFGAHTFQTEIGGQFIHHQWE